MISQRSGPARTPGAGITQRHADAVRRAAAEFAAELAARRTARFDSQRELAHEMRYTPSYISHIMSGRQNPSRTFARRADQVLGTGRVFEELWRAFEAARRAPHDFGAEVPAPGAGFTADPAGIGESGGIDDFAAPISSVPRATEFPRGDTGFLRTASAGEHGRRGGVRAAEVEPEKLALIIAEMDGDPVGMILENMFRAVSDLPAGPVSRVAVHLRRMGRVREAEILISIAGNRSSSTVKYGELADLLRQEGLISSEAEFAALVRRRRANVQLALENGTGFHGSGIGLPGAVPGHGVLPADREA